MVVVVDLSGGDSGRWGGICEWGESGRWDGICEWGDSGRWDGICEWGDSGRWGGGGEWGDSGRWDGMMWVIGKFMRCGWGGVGKVMVRGEQEVGCGWCAVVCGVMYGDVW